MTRPGRPVALVLSYEDYIQRKKTIPYEFALLISQNFPLRGKEARDALQAHFDTAANKAAEDGLTEEDVTRMLNEE